MHFSDIMTEFSARRIGAISIILIFVSSMYVYQNIANTKNSAVSAVVLPQAKTPIQHIVIIMQENHPFDNMFGTYPGLPQGFGLNLSTCIPLSISQRAMNPCIKPWNADSKQLTIQGRDLGHTRGS